MFLPLSHLDSVVVVSILVLSVARNASVPHFEIGTGFVA